MKKLTLSRSSRYVKTPLYQLADSSGFRTNSFVFGVWSRIPVEDRADDYSHTVNQSEVGRLDIVSYTYYADPLLWWVIADKNGINDPFEDMYAGQILRIPSLDSVRQALESSAVR